MRIIQLFCFMVFFTKECWKTLIVSEIPVLLLFIDNFGYSLWVWTFITARFYQQVLLSFFFSESPNLHFFTNLSIQFALVNFITELFHDFISSNLYKSIGCHDYHSFCNHCEFWATFSRFSVHDITFVAWFSFIVPLTVVFFFRTARLDYSVLRFSAFQTSKTLGFS